MVKEVKGSIVQLDWTKHSPKEFLSGDPQELVTVPDVGYSLRQMIETGTVGSFGVSKAYQYPDLEDDDDLAHEHPDYEKLNQLDMVEKENYVNEWLNKPNNYEKKENSSTEASASSEADDQSAKKEDERSESD